MKLFLVTLFVGFAAAAKLSGNYLPPSSAHTSGGHGSFLQGPHSSAGFGHSSFGAGQGAGHGVGAGAFSHGHGALGGGAFSGGHGGHGGSGGSGAYGGGQYQHRQPSGPPIPIIKYENVNNGDGSYHFEYATGNGITQQEQGHLNNPGSEYAEQVVQGSYSYTGDDGHVYTVHYKADANGFQASGDHLPTPPPIPEAIQKSLVYNAAHAGSGDTGAYSGQYDSGAYSGSYSQPSRPQQQYLPPSRPSFGSGSGSGYNY